MKKRITLLCAFMLLVLSGCGNSKVAMEDYVQTNPSTNEIKTIMETENGYYYNNTFGTMSLHYFDKDSQKTIFLCNKPECEHDGNEFCSATNSSYRVLNNALYGNYIYINTYKAKNQEQSHQLLRAKLDGTELTEVSTYLTYTGHSIVSTVSEMILHRGKAFITYETIKELKVDEDFVGDPESQVGVVGLVMIDLATGKSETLLEYTLEESEYLKNLNAYDDYIYYTTRSGHKTSLSRYNYLTGETQVMNLLVNFGGKYTLIDENTLCYIRDDIYTYHIDTGESELFTDRLYHEITYSIPEVDTPITQKINYTPLQILYYNDYLIVKEIFPIIDASFEPPYMGGDTVYHIFSLDHSEVATFSISPLQCDTISDLSIKILNDTVYYQIGDQVNKCSFSDILTGNPVWTEAFTYDLPVPTNETKGDT